MEFNGTLVEGKAETNIFYTIITYTTVASNAQWRKKQKKIHSKKLIVAQNSYNK